MKKAYYLTPQQPQQIRKIVYQSAFSPAKIIQIRPKTVSSYYSQINRYNTPVKSKQIIMNSPSISPQKKYPKKQRYDAFDMFKNSYSPNFYHKIK